MGEDRWAPAPSPVAGGVAVKTKAIHQVTCPVKSMSAQGEGYLLEPTKDSIHRNGWLLYISGSTMWSSRVFQGLREGVEEGR